MRVRASGNPVTEPHTTGYGVPDTPRHASPALRSLRSDVRIAADSPGADLVHSRTWHADAAGHLAALVHGIPHVMTMHSLAPLRRWKAEQLGGRYALSAWLERSAVEAAAGVIAVSGAHAGRHLRGLSARRPWQGSRHPQRNRRGELPAGSLDRRAGPLRRRPRSAHHPARRPGDPAEGPAPPFARGPRPPPGSPARAVLRPAGHPGR
ncbi:glycosyltransferase family 4 protein [Streptomyces achromogenes]|uniref:glycosyltransferase family 4 protein n=1 Tax=Streptomyces achromogenes TaxID=67255 RepID=UPI0036885188